MVEINFVSDAGVRKLSGDFSRMTLPSLGSTMRAAGSANVLDRRYSSSGSSARVGIDVKKSAAVVAKMRRDLRTREEY